MSGTCSKHGETRNAYIVVGISVDVGIDGRIILKLVFKKQDAD
jgi:hypothetical protein